MSAVALHVQADVEDLRTEISIVRFEAAEATVKVQRLDTSASAATAMAQQAATDTAETRKALEELSARVERMTATGGAGGRTVARIGNLGWDTEPQELQARGAEILRLSGVPVDSHGRVAPVVGARGTGSMAEVAFRDAAGLQAARIAVKAQRHEFLPGKTAWLDEAKTRAETAPVRMMLRLAEAIQEIEGERADAAAVTRDARSRSVSCGGRKLAYVCEDRVVWTTFGAQRYGADDRAFAAAAATAM